MSEKTLFPKIDVYLINCSTGCTCCSHEDHKRGPYSNVEIARKKVDKFIEKKILVSQFAPEGVYTIEKYKGEKLPDGRIICGERVFEGFCDLEEMCEKITGDGLFDCEYIK